MLGQQPIFPLCLIGNLFLGYPIVTHKTVLVIKPTGHWSNLIWKKNCCWTFQSSKFSIMHGQTQNIIPMSYGQLILCAYQSLL